MTDLQADHGTELLRSLAQLLEKAGAQVKCLHGDPDDPDTMDAVLALIITPHTELKSIVTVGLEGTHVLVDMEYPYESFQIKVDMSVPGSLGTLMHSMAMDRVLSQEEYVAAMKLLHE